MAVEITGILLSEEIIQARVDELARQISNDYADVDELLLIGVLRGAFIFLADLSRRLTIPRRVDFVSVVAYTGTSTSPGAVRLLLDTRSNIGGKHVLLVEDIVDTGATLRYLMKMLEAREPASLKCCTFLRKPARVAGDVPPIDYLGFDIPNVWVVGYGLDYADQYRTLPYVATVKPIESG